MSLIRAALTLWLIMCSVVIGALVQGVSPLITPKGVREWPLVLAAIGIPLILAAAGLIFGGESLAGTDTDVAKGE